MTAYVGERTHKRLQKVNFAACDGAQGLLRACFEGVPLFVKMGWEVLRKDPLNGKTAD